LDRGQRSQACEGSRKPQGGGGDEDRDLGREGLNGLEGVAELVGDEGPDVG
jgi:hypothetical protein